MPGSRRDASTDAPPPRRLRCRQGPRGIRFAVLEEHVDQPAPVPGPEHLTGTHQQPVPPTGRVCRCPQQAVGGRARHALVLALTKVARRCNLATIGKQFGRQVVELRHLPTTGPLDPVPGPAQRLIRQVELDQGFGHPLLLIRRRQVPTKHLDQRWHVPIQDRQPLRRVPGREPITSDPRRRNRGHLGSARSLPLRYSWALADGAGGSDLHTSDLRPICEYGQQEGGHIQRRRVRLRVAPGR